MTELSYLWDGLVTGDATEAPYDKIKFNKFMFGPSVSRRDDQAYVIPGYLNDLEVSYTGSFSLAVKAGAAIIKNYLYINDAEVALTFTKPDGISSAFYNSRIDYVVLRLDNETRTVRLAIVEGEEVYANSEQPIPPTLTQNVTVWEAPLALVTLRGYDTEIQWGFIHDRRRFITNAYTQHKFFNTSINLVQNSEFMILNAANDLPENWTKSGGAGITPVSKTEVMARGQGIAFTTNPESSEGIFHFVPIENLQVGDVFTLRGTMRKTATSQQTMSLYVYGSNASLGHIGPDNYLELKFGEITVDEERQFCSTFKLNNVYSGVRGLAIKLTNQINANVLGQLVLTRGYHPGPLRQITENIPFLEAVTDASWTDTAKSTGTTTIDLTSDFNAQVQPQTKAVMLRLRARDSGSAAGTPYMRILGYSASYPTEYGRLDLQGVPNDVYREVTCVVPVNQPLYDAQSAAPQFRIDVVASGAGTLDATVEILGMWV